MKHLLEGCCHVTLEEMLEAREKRASIQKKLLSEYGHTLICFTLIIPGEYKRFPLAIQTYNEGKMQLLRQLERHNITILHHKDWRANTGDEGYFIVSADAGAVKKLTLEIESNHALGRLFDLDVMDTNGNAVCRRDYGEQERTCLICSGPVWQCSRSRNHSAEKLVEATLKIMQDYFRIQYADSVARQAVRALLYEVSVTPKPGLVDRKNNGAHSDMSFYTFVDSATALFPYFREITLKSMTYNGRPEGLLAHLRYLGKVAEDTMLIATEGVNTHKGAIFSMGIICAAIGYLYGNDISITQDTLFNLSARISGEAIVELPQRDCRTHGERVFSAYGLTGIRGEAAKGFPNVRRYGYPVLKKMLRQGYSINNAGVAALLYLLAYVQDTNIVHRAGTDILDSIQIEIRSFLDQEPDIEKILSYMENLDKEFTQQNVSPGGCADLLAVSYLLLFCL